MRRVPLLLLQLFVVFSFQAFTAYAEEGSTELKTQLKVTATIPDGFNKTILISFTSKDQTNVMSRLDQGNGYQVVQEIIPPGTYQIGFINIVGGNVTDYNIDVMDTFEVIEGKETQLPLKLAMKNNSESQGSSKDIELPVSDTKATVNLERSGNTNQSIATVDSIALPENPTMINKPTATAKVPLSETQVRVIISFAILVLIALLWYLYRQISYKHDYYDC
ncbi:hypothetical protein MUG84_00140 [Paenibacillus sp. KQZ6P-2]|uniref:NEAT domain-containing protein n=1 Tax=Paenibacillus mangrovi TaxID=2931978 RepID=A0A9X1WJQ8_9BACL|nr:hypothetical protein [Paenibacillus mangrovi]MCJ8010149.1 hypothetical protein [Paenibacillus mangrovi]